MKFIRANIVQEAIIIAILTMIVLVLIYLLISSLAKPSSSFAYYSLLSALISSSCNQPQYTTNFNFISSSNPIIFQAYTDGACIALLEAHQVKFVQYKYYLCYANKSSEKGILTVPVSYGVSALITMCSDLEQQLVNANITCVPLNCGNANIPLETFTGQLFVYMAQIKLPFIQIKYNATDFVLTYPPPH
jgi:hypothetical protein